MQARPPGLSSAGGFLRCFLRDATPAERQRFAAALADAISPARVPRYLVSRLVPAPGRGWPGLLARSVTGRAVFGRRWVAVPADFGRNSQRAERFAAAWRRWLGPAGLQFTQRSEAGRESAADAGAQAADYLVSSRQIWV